jgi:hypothetical protein
MAEIGLDGLEFADFQRLFGSANGESGIRLNAGGDGVREEHNTHSMANRGAVFGQKATVSDGRESQVCQQIALPK